MTHTLIVAAQVLELENAAASMEAHHRAFLITNQPDFLDQAQLYGSAAAFAILRSTAEGQWS